MSNYPESADVFVNKTGSDNIASSDPNNAFDGIEATQGMIGALGKPQSWSTTLMTLLRKHQRGLRVEATGGNLYVRSGEAVLESTDGNLHAFRYNSGDVTLSTAEIDAGTIAATFYYVYMYGPGAATTGPIIYSTDALSPYGIGTAPYKKIGWFNNAIAASLTPTFAGAWREASDEPNFLSAVVSSTDATLSTTYDTLEGAQIDFISSGRPVKFQFKVNFSCLNSNAYGYFILELDGVEITGSESLATPGANTSTTTERFTGIVNWSALLASGAHVAKIKWKVVGTTGYAGAMVFTAEET